MGLVALAAVVTLVAIVLAISDEGGKADSVVHGRSDRRCAAGYPALVASGIGLRENLSAFAR